MDDTFQIKNVKIAVYKCIYRHFEKQIENKQKVHFKDIWFYMQEELNINPTQCGIFLDGFVKEYEFDYDDDTMHQYVIFNKT